MSSSLTFTDTDGNWRLSNGKPFPADRFSLWTPVSTPVGDSASRLSDGAITMFRLRTDFAVSFSLPGVPCRRVTNRLSDPEALGSANWTPVEATVTTDALASPDGPVTAEKIAETAAIDIHAVRQGDTGLITNTIYTLSAYLKAAERSWAWLGFSGKDGTMRRAWFDVSTGTRGSTQGTPTDYGIIADRAGWFRAWVAASVGTGAATGQSYVGVAPIDGSASYAGSVGNGIYAWGTQLDFDIARPQAYHFTGAGVSPAEIADRLIYHLQNGGTCAVNTGDADGNSYVTCGLKPGTTPQLTLSDRRTMEYELSVQLINLAGSPSRVLARYVEV